MWGKSLLGCLGLLFVIISTCARAESGLNGMAVYSELGNELFIAALYSEQTGTNAQELINGSYPKRIELKILSRSGITERQLNRLWRESIAINNDQSLLISQADNMVYFEGLVRDRLEANDHLVIDFIPAKGISVSLNTVELGRIDDTAFFGLLLRSWIGLVPSSTRFRDDLLSVTMVDAALVNRFRNMYPRTARIEAVKNWYQTPLPDADEQEEAVAATPPEPIAVTSLKAPVVAPVVAAPVVVAKSRAASSAAQVTVPKTEESVMATNNLDEANLASAQELLAKQFYIADVFKKIYGQVNYPKRAQELQQAGTVRLSVVIDAVGNLKHVEPTEASRFLLLNKAALEAVRKAAPFAPLPNGIDLTELEMTVPITFSLDRS